MSNDGMLPCAVKACWHCSIDACTNIVVREETVEKKIPKCADIIESEDITRAIRGYYKGGRLKLDVPLEKPSKRFFTNIVPTPPPEAKPVTIEPVAVSSNVNTYGMTFGGGSLTDRDWDFISGVMAKYKVKSVLEFGAGLSTLLFNDSRVKIVTYESKQGWIDKILALNPKCNIKLWDGKVFECAEKRSPLYDLAFVDGPAGDFARDISTEAASIFANVIIVHDAGREHARKYQEKFIKPHFDGPFKGGHRCHLWVRKGFMKSDDSVKESVKTEGSFDLKMSASKNDHTLKISELPAHDCGASFLNKKKYIKIVSTARGWGGCARSVTTIMKFLVDAGHKVQFIPFRNAVTSKEYLEALATDLKGVEVALGYSAIKEACDVMLVYADDFVWEFKTPEVSEIISEINAEKKIMMLNYRRGEVGKIAWTRNWDQYLFLCSLQEEELLKVHPEAQGRTKVLPPCTILEPFLAVKPDYGNGIRIMRHNSQGDTKFISASFPKEKVVMEIENVLNCRPDVDIFMLPGPTFINANPRFNKVAKTADPAQIAKSLSAGNLFWYSLPYGYTDMGPRVILEAMAVGLPVMADSWSGGAIDRVPADCGLITEHKNWVPFVQSLTEQGLRNMGQKCKERAYNEFRPEKWMEVILS